MVATVLAVLFIICAVVMLAKGTFDYDSQTTYSLRPWALIPGACAALILVFTSFTIVSPGNVGVPVAFGNAAGAVPAGFHVKPPWSHIKSINVRVQNYTMSSAQGEGKKVGDDSVPVHTADQAVVNVDSTALFRLTVGKARDVYVNVGSDYIETIVRPTIRSAIRDAATPYNAVDLATSKRAAFQEAARAQIERELSKYGIQIVDLQIRDLHLNQSIQKSIDRKVAAQQDAEQQQFVLQKVSQQAQQRIVEANGLARSQEIIRSTLTPQYLQHEYITALEKLVGSPNTTFMFLPGDPNNLPNFQLPLTVKR